MFYLFMCGQMTVLTLCEPSSVVGGIRLFLYKIIKRIISKASYKARYYPFSINLLVKAKPITEIKIMDVQKINKILNEL